MDLRPITHLAHQGGWDEIGLFAVPVLVALGAVWLVERRQKRRDKEAPPAGHDGEENRDG